MEYIMKQNDTYPFFKAQLKDAKGIVNIEYSNVKLHLTRPNGEEKLNTPMTVIDAEEGIVEYEWLPEDTSEIGIFLGEIQVTYQNGKILTFPNDSYFKVKFVKELL